MQQKSVLTVYKFDTADVEKFSFSDADKFLARNYGKKAICMEVIRFEHEPMVLATSIEEVVAGDPKLKAHIDELKQNGANFIFVGPVVGKAYFGRALV
jgi:hypothetical protein